jgi:hypothetical protein
MKDATVGDNDLKAHFNFCRKDEHVPPIERRIRTRKEVSAVLLTLSLSPIGHAPLSLNSWVSVYIG